MVRTQIQLTEKQAESLKKRSAEKKISMAELIREAVDIMLEFQSYPSDSERKKNAIEAAGKFRSGDNDLAENHDRYLNEIYK